MIKNSYSAEDAVDIIADKVTWKSLLLFIGLMTFNTVAALIAYFPNFGGFVPYEDWRCISENCSKVQPPLKTSGWQLADPLDIDRECTIDVKGMDVKESGVRLLSRSKKLLGTITIKFDKGILEISGNDSCVDVNDLKCNGTVTFPSTTAAEVCSLKMASVAIPKQPHIKCGDTFMSLLDPYVWMVNSGSDVRHMSFFGINAAQLTCPDDAGYDKKALCSSNYSLKSGEDFVWITDGRTSFSLDWDLYCDREFLLTLVGSLYFGGALLGTAAGGTLYDVIGRKLGSIIGYVVLIVATFCASFSPSLYFMLAYRFFQGLGNFVGYTGLFVLLLEFSASKNRNYFNSAILFAWAIGYCLCTFIAYFIYSWKWLSTVPGFILVILMIPLILIPESPRYYFTLKGNEGAAKRSLKWLASIHNFEGLPIDDIRLKDNTVKGPETKRASFLETFLDFIKYPELTIQMLLQMFLWISAGFLYYGFSFSWSKLGSNIYISYLYAAVGEILAYVGMTFPLHYFGRKLTLMFFYAAASVSFFLAMIRVSIGSLTVEQLSCLFGSMFVAAAFGSIYLYTIELSPTTHRGRLLGYCSFAARIGSFAGPQASLLFDWNRFGTLAIFGILSGLGALCLVRLPRTKDLPTPNTAADVQARKTARINTVVIENPGKC